MNHSRGTIVASAGWLALLALTALAQPAPRGSAIKFSEPKKDTVSTNLNQYAEKARDNLRRLEEESNRPLDMLGQADEERVVPALPRPPAGPAIRSKRVRDLLDRQKNWQFASPEEQLTGLTAEEIMGVPQFDEQGRKKPSVSTFERYYQSLTQTQAGATNRLSDSRSGRGDDEPWLSSEERSGEKSGDPVQARLLETEKSLQNLLKTDMGLKFFPESQQLGSMPDLFNAPPIVKTPEEKAQELRLDKFRQMIQADYSKPGGLAGMPGVNSGAGFATPGAALKPMASPNAGTLFGAGLAGSPAAPETKPPSVSPLDPVRIQFPSPVGTELPRRKF